MGFLLRNGVSFALVCLLGFLVLTVGEEVV